MFARCDCPKLIMMFELEGFMENFNGKLDSSSTHLIKHLLEVNSFTSFSKRIWVHHVAGSLRSNKDMNL